MIFKNITNKIVDAHAYGYVFQPGQELDVTEPNLIDKFKLYKTLECFIEGDFTEELTRDELKAKADEMGIKYSPKIRTETLRQMVE